jgi:hypothetical protein
MSEDRVGDGLLDRWVGAGWVSQSLRYRWRRWAERNRRPPNKDANVLGLTGSLPGPAALLIRTHARTEFARP